MASAACIKSEGVPVEFKVATILFPIIALFPIPVTTTLPLEFKIAFTESSKSLFSISEIFFNASASRFITYLAIVNKFLSIFIL